MCTYCKAIVLKSYWNEKWFSTLLGRMCGHHMAIPNNGCKKGTFNFLCILYIKFKYAPNIHFTVLNLIWPGNIAVVLNVIFQSLTFKMSVFSWRSLPLVASTGSRLKVSIHVCHVLRTWATTSTATGIQPRSTSWRWKVIWWTWKLVCPNEYRWSHRPHMSTNGLDYIV